MKHLQIFLRSGVELKLFLLNSIFLKNPVFKYKRANRLILEKQY
jgi:hypothetical protein